MPAPLLLQLNTRCWLRELNEGSDAAVHLGRVPDETVASWRSLGFTHVWAMGVWTNGPKARRQARTDPGLRAAYDRALPGWTEDDVAGSPYAVAEYRVPRALGGDAGLKTFRKQLRRHGLKLVLDFVPNHVGLDHPWIHEHPHRFVQSAEAGTDTFIGGSADYPVRLCHGKDPHFAGWPDTAQLDFRLAETQRCMIEELVSIAEKCDGVRCDMAMLLLADVFRHTWRNEPAHGAETNEEFWPAAIKRVHETHPAFILVAEVYWDMESRLHDAGFDYCYRKAVTDALVRREYGAVQERLVSLSRRDAEGGVYFLENHDEARVAALLDFRPHLAAALTVLSLPGMRLLYDGQLDGHRVQTPVQLGRRRREERDTVVHAMYHRLLKVIGRTSVGVGAAEILNPLAAWDGNDSYRFMVVVQWQSDPDTFHLSVTNHAPHAAQCYVQPGVRALDGSTWQMVDLLGDEHYEREGCDLRTRGLYLDVPAFAAQLFEFKRA